jgi:hypothetical protein
MARLTAITLVLLAGNLVAAQLESAEALAFGPPGILFVGDSQAGAVVAFDTGDRKPPAGDPVSSIQGLDQKAAALLGTRPSDIRFHDVKVNPLSKNIYLAVSRGRGPDAIPLILRVDSTGALSVVDLASLPSTRVELPGLPGSQVARRRTSRTMVISDLQYSAGRVIVAGLSNEDFSSTLRVVPYPFGAADRGTSIEIYHTSHFAYETNSPVRTMVPYSHGGEQFLLAAYTCTPLVKLRLSDLKDGAHITGDTLAELGRHNSPIDMILYQRGGQDFLLVANTLHGVQRLSLSGFDKFEPVNQDGGDDSQIPVQRIASLKAVVLLDAYDETRALAMFDLKDRLDLRLVPLP